MTVSLNSMFRTNISLKPQVLVKKSTEKLYRIIIIEQTNLLNKDAYKIASMSLDCSSLNFLLMYYTTFISLYEIHNIVSILV